MIYIITVGEKPLCDLLLKLAYWAKSQGKLSRNHNARTQIQIAA
ncbi:hypothetical protein NIES4075_19450 [Tolypothrix sp. NIES-4075]|nr:hypothetical protein [Tolypothrix sp. NIES-4075]GAX40977.1 hypothetical protein NIES4075_19450 [Tolypothrix sp. NIES-4075]